MAQCGCAGAQSGCAGALSGHAEKQSGRGGAQSGRDIDYIDLMLTSRWMAPSLINVDFDVNANVDVDIRSSSLKANDTG